jgi:hypothetical protein
LIEKSFENLASFDFLMVVGVVPVKLSIAVTASVGSDMNYIICPQQNVISLSIEPSFKIGISASAAVTIIVAEGGVSINANFNYRIKKRLAVQKGVLCSSLSHLVQPLIVNVEGYLSLLFIKWSQEIYKWEASETLEGVIVDSPRGCTEQLLNENKTFKKTKVSVAGFRK